VVSFFVAFPIWFSKSDSQLEVLKSTPPAYVGS
jgi:hypothetical protein